MNAKPTLFISHLSEEKEVAIALKSLLEDHFGDQLTVFVSSDEESIRVGERWLDSVSHHLKSCVATIVMCSPASITRHWLHFEAGASWIQDLPVMPVCYGGLTTQNLPEPLRQLQAVDADDEKSVSRLVRNIAATVKVTINKADPKKFVELIKQWKSAPVADTTVARFYAVSADIQQELPELIRSANESLVLSGNHFNISLTNRHPVYVDALARGLSVSFSVLAPDSPAIARIAELTGSYAEVLEGACRHCKSLLSRLKKDFLALPKQTRGRLVIRSSHHQLVARAYAFDHSKPSGKLLFSPYLRGYEPTQSPTMMLPAGHLAYSSFVSSVLLSVADSEIVYDSQLEIEKD